MSKSVRNALEKLLEALENHYEVSADDDATDEALARAELLLRNAFFTYDDYLFTEYDVELPFEIIDDDDSDDDYEFFELDEDEYESQDFGEDENEDDELYDEDFE